MKVIENTGLTGLRLMGGLMYTALQGDLAQLCYYIQASSCYFIWLATSHTCFNHFFGSCTDFGTSPQLPKCFKDYWEEGLAHATISF